MKPSAPKPGAGASRAARPRRKPPTRHHHGDLRNALLAQALAIIERHGLEAVTMRALARGVGVSEAALYHHFSDKAALLATLAAGGYARLHAAMRARIDAAGPDPFDRLAALGRAYVETALAHPGMFRLMFGRHMVALAEDPDLYRIAHPAAALLDEVAAACARAVGADARDVTRAAWSMVHGVAWLVIEQEIRFAPGEPGVEALLATSSRILIEGIRAQKTHRGGR